MEMETAAGIKISSTRQAAREANALNDKKYLLDPNRVESFHQVTARLLQEALIANSCPFACLTTTTDTVPGRYVDEPGPSSLPSLPSSTTEQERVQRGEGGGSADRLPPPLPLTPYQAARVPRGED